MRWATRDTVADVEVEIDRPGDRARKLDTLRSDDNTTQSVSGSGSSETDWIQNNSAGNWYLERVSFGTAGASPGTLVAIIRIKDTDGAVRYGLAGCCNQNNIDFDGALIKPGWKVTYEILQGDSNSYTVNLWPVVRKPSPSEDSSSSAPEPAIVIDSFEDGNISEYSGTTANASVQSSITYQGNQALKIDGNSSNVEEMYSTSGLDNYPEKGDTFQYHVRATATSGDMRPRFGFDTTDLSNTYRIIHEFDGGTVQLLKEESTSEELLASKSLSLSADEWVQVKVNYNDTITVTTYDGDGNNLGAISASDSLPASAKGGGIMVGLDASTGESAYYDYFEII